MDAGRSKNGNRAFGAWLKSAITARGMTQNEFASAIGASKSSVSRWINGDAPKGTYVERIADVLVLDYDFVATKAGIRPRELAEDEDDIIKRELLPMLRRIDFSDPIVLDRVKDDLGFWIKRQGKGNDT